MLIPHRITTNTDRSHLPVLVLLLSAVHATSITAGVLLRSFWSRIKQKTFPLECSNASSISCDSYVSDWTPILLWNNFTFSPAILKRALSRAIPIIHVILSGILTCVISCLIEISLRIRVAIVDINNLYANLSPLTQLILALLTRYIHGLTMLLMRDSPCLKPYKL